MGRSHCRLRGCPNVVTVRNCSIAQSFLCVALSTTMCTYLAMDSGNRAVTRVKDAGDDGVSKVKVAGDEGVGGCFSTANDNIVKMTNQVLGQLATRTDAYMTEFTSRPRLLAQEFAKFMSAFHPNQTLDWTWQREVMSPWMKAKYDGLVPFGLHFLGHVTPKNQMRMLYEREETFGPPFDLYPTDTPTKYHDVSMISNNGSDYGPACDNAPCPFLIQKNEGEKLGAEWNVTADGLVLSYVERDGNTGGKWDPMWPFQASGGRDYIGRPLLTVNGLSANTTDQLKHITSPLTDLVFIFGGSGICCRSLEGTVDDISGDYPAGQGGLAAGTRPCEMEEFGENFANWWPTNAFVSMHIRTEGKQKGGPCPIWGMNPGDPGGAQLLDIAKFLVPMRGRIGEPRWSPIIPASSYIDLAVIIGYGHPDAPPQHSFMNPLNPAALGKTGVIWTSIELSHINTFMRSVRVGNSKLRLAAVVASAWLHNAVPAAIAPLPDQAYMLVGTSHGSGVLRDWQRDELKQQWRMSGVVRMDVNATDPVVRSIARYAHSPAAQKPVQATEYITCCSGHGLQYQLGGTAGPYPCPDENNGHHDGVSRPCSPKGERIDADGQKRPDGYEAMSRSDYVKVDVQWLDEEGNCFDDEEGIMDGIGGSCPQAMKDCAAHMRALQGDSDSDHRGGSGNSLQKQDYCCNYDLSTGRQPVIGNPFINLRFANMPPGYMVQDVCRRSCPNADNTSDNCASRSGAKRVRDRGTEFESTFDEGVEPFFVRVQRFDDGFGLDLWIVIAIDHEYILGEVEREQEQTRVKIEITNKQVDEDIEEENEKVAEQRAKDTLLLIVLVVGLVCVLVVFSVVFATLITRPIRKLGRDMTEVAQMNLDDVDDTKKWSRLAEVRRMQKGFLKMVWAMREYRNYMPQSVLGFDQEDDQAGEGDEVLTTRSQHTGSRSAVSRSTRGGSTMMTSRRSGGRNAGKSQGGTSASRGTSHRGESSMGTSQSRSKAAALKAHLAKTTGQGISKKKVTFAAFGFRGWHGHFTRIPDNEMSETHAELLSAMLVIFSGNKGVPDVFSGDRILVCYNSMRPLGTHKTASCNTAMALVDLEISLQQDAAGSPHGGDLTGLKGREVPEFNAGICTGDAKVGNMGCGGMKKYSHMSTSVTFAFAIERWSMKWSTQCLIDLSVFQEAENNFQLRLVDELVMRKRSPKEVPVYQLADRKSVGEDEWMYQLEEAANAVNEYTHWNDAMTAVKEQKWDVAKQALWRLLTPAAGPALGGAVNGGSLLGASPRSMRKKSRQGSVSPSPRGSMRGGSPTRGGGSPAAKLGGKRVMASGADCATPRSFGGKSPRNRPHGRNSVFGSPHASPGAGGAGKHTAKIVARLRGWVADSKVFVCTIVEWH